MPRLVSFIVLVAVILLVTALFFRVMLEFLVPMFLAAVLVVVFRPLHKWLQVKLTGHPRLAAAATTICIVLIVLLPSAAIAWNAYLEVASFARQMLEVSSEPSAEAPLEDGSGQPSDLVKKFDAMILAITDPLQERLGIETPAPEQIREIFVEMVRSRAGEAGAAALVAGQWAALTFVRLVVGLVIMVISIYYFLADGPSMIVTIMHLSPLDDRYELELLERFNNISRSVVVATLLSAFVQGVLAGIGFYLAGIRAVFALTGLTMLLAVVPFLGAAAVWLPTSAWLFFAEGRAGAAIGLALYGLTVVSTIDNLIKPYVLHGQSNLHPLLALLSVLGGVAALGPIGILVGPMAVAFLQALLGMLQREIQEIGQTDANGPGPARSSVSRPGEEIHSTNQQKEPAAEVPVLPQARNADTPAEVESHHDETGCQKRSHRPKGGGKGKRRRRK